MTTRKLVDEVFVYTDGHPDGCTYRTYDTGEVVAYGPEMDAPRPNLWIASVWSAHPLNNPDAAEHLGHLAADSTRRDFEANLRHWERTGEIR